MGSNFSFTKNPHPHMQYHKVQRHIVLILAENPEQTGPGLRGSDTEDLIIPVATAGKWECYCQQEENRDTVEKRIACFLQAIPFKKAGIFTGLSRRFPEKNVEILKHGTFDYSKLRLYSWK